MSDNLKTALALLGLATFCALTHYWVVSWLVHSVGHGYKWITVLMTGLWVVLLGLLTLNLAFARRRKAGDQGGPRIWQPEGHQDVAI